MLTSERQEFDSHIEVLCAGFNIPATAERKDAYWRGLSRMHMHGLIRVIDHALSEEGPDKPPSAPQLWRLHRQLQDRRRGPTALHLVQPNARKPLVVDRFAQIGTVALITFLLRRGAASQASIVELVRQRSRLVADFRLIADEDPSLTDEQMRERYVSAFDRLFEARSTSECERDRESFGLCGRFPGFTADELARVGA